MGRLFKKLFGSNDDSFDNGIRTFCKNEYGKDWYFAYVSYKQDGKFPNTLRVKV